MSKKTENKFEHFRKKGVNAYSNIRSLYGKEGENLLNTIMDAVDKTYKETFTELKDTIRNPKVKDLSNQMKTRLDSVVNGDVKWSDIVSSVLDTLKDEHEDKKTGKECKCTTPCKNCTCKKDKKMNDVNVQSKKTNNIVIDNDVNAKIDGESASTHLVRRKHQDYINSLSDMHNPEASPLPTALSRLYNQVDQAYKKQKQHEKIVLSNVEKTFITDIMNVLFTALDAKFDDEPEDASDDSYDDYDDYSLPVFVTEDEVNDLSNKLPTSFEDGTDYWFHGIEDLEVPGIGVRIKFSKYPTEIRQRLIANSDKGRLVELVAILTSFNKLNVSFIHHNNDEGEIFFIFDDDTDNYNFSVIDDFIPEDSEL